MQQNNVYSDHYVVLIGTPAMSVKSAIEQKLISKFSPDYLEVINESHMHNVPPGSESHFKVVLVTAQFESMNKVKRHQSIYQVLSQELEGEVHALALHTMTPGEWQLKGDAPESPQCLGGSKSA